MKQGHNGSNAVLGWDRTRMSTSANAGFSRRALLGIFAATTITAAPRMSKAFAFNRGAGDIRRLKMYSGRTGERLDAIYWVDGDYIPEVLAEVDQFFRDWRIDRSHRIDPHGMELLKAYSWPGNIRELENVIERLLVIAPEDHIPAGLIAAQLGGAPMLSRGDLDSLPLEEAVYTFEKRLIEHALRKADGVKRQAARLLGINASSLYYKLEKFGLLDDGEAS